MKLIVVDPTRSRKDKLLSNKCLENSLKTEKKKTRQCDLNIPSTTAALPLVFHNAHIKRGLTEQRFSLEEPEMPKRKIFFEPQRGGNRFFSVAKAKDSSIMKSGLDSSSFRSTSHKVAKQFSSNQHSKITFIPSISDESKRPAAKENKLRSPSPLKSQKQNVIKFAHPAETFNGSRGVNGYTRDMNASKPAKLDRDNLSNGIAYPPHDGPDDGSTSDHPQAVNGIVKLKSEMRRNPNKNQLQLQSGYSTCTFRVNIKNR